MNFRRIFDILTKKFRVFSTVSSPTSPTASTAAASAASSTSSWPSKRGTSAAWAARPGQARRRPAKEEVQDVDSNDRQRRQRGQRQQGTATGGAGGRRGASSGGRRICAGRWPWPESGPRAARSWAPAAPPRTGYTLRNRASCAPSATTTTSAVTAAVQGQPGHGLAHHAPEAAPGHQQACRQDWDAEDADDAPPFGGVSAQHRQQPPLCL